MKKKLKRRKKFLYLLTAILPLFIVCFSFANNLTTASAAYKSIEGGEIYILPPVNVTNRVSDKAIIPSIIVAYPETAGKPIVYTLTANTSRDGLSYGARNFVYNQDTGKQECSFQLATFYNNGNLGLYINWSLVQTSTIRWTNNPINPTEHTFTLGQIVVKDNQVDYTMAGNEASFSLTVNFDSPTNGSTVNYNYSATFQPTQLFSTLNGADYFTGYDDGYNVGKSEGISIGYKRGVDDAGNFTFMSLISAVIDVPINSFKSLLDFDFLGFNILQFVLSLLTFVLVVKIVGLLTGG